MEIIIIIINKQTNILLLHWHFQSCNAISYGSRYYYFGRRLQENHPLYSKDKSSLSNIKQHSITVGLTFPVLLVWGLSVANHHHHQHLVVLSSSSFIHHSSFFLLLLYFLFFLFLLFILLYIFCRQG